MKYSICPGDNKENSAVWDTVLGAKWDHLSGREGQSEFVIDQMKITETKTNHYVFSIIKINWQGVIGFYQNNPSYREAIAESSINYNFRNFISKSEDKDDADAANADSGIAEFLN